jgi:methyl-accepting chemotaxis protein
MDVHRSGGPMGPGVAAFGRLGLGAKLSLLAVGCALLGAAALGAWVQQHGWTHWGSLALIAAAVLVAWLLTALYLQMAGALGALESAVLRMKQGDLSRRIEIRGEDEFARIGAALDAVNETISGLVADIRSSSLLVTAASTELTSDTADLSSRTEQQSANLEQTSASVQQLDATVRQNASDAREAEALAARVHGLAGSGGGAMREAVDSMHAIKAGSEKVGDIIGVIDSIAFQTNILALNAAVEAARAGEQGRGFAVVAAEVRALAQRSGEAAREIKQLIEQSGAETASGVGHIDRVSGVLSEIVGGIAELTGRMGRITSAVGEQSDGLAQVSQAMTQLDSLTHQNAQMVEQTSRACASLGERARQLSAAAGGFKLRQGTADEAQALVQRAITFYKERGGAAALPGITEPGNGFSDRDMYVFAWDRQLVYHAFGGKPANVGKSAKQIIGTDVTKLAHDVWAAAAAGGGWVDYDFLNPANGQVLPKTSYIVPVAQDLVLGCGIYKTRRG